MSLSPRHRYWSLVFASLLAATAFLGCPPRPAITVPNVVGTSQSTAEDAITQAGLEVGTVTERYSSTVDEGEVISQSPGAGARVDRGSNVNLVVSIGPDPDFNQGTPGDKAYLSESGHSIFFDTGNQMGDDFRLTGRTSTITHVTWWGAYANNTPVEDNFLLTVYRDNGAGMPETGGYWEFGAGDQVNRTATSGVVDPGVRNLTIYEYSCNVEDWDFETDTTYYLSIVNDTASGTWMWCVNGSSSEGNGFGVHRVTWGEDWTSNIVDSAFVLRP